jgi:uncharacterized cupredoxin-like copper-binding protein
MKIRVLLPILFLCALVVAACGRGAHRGNRIDVETHDLWYGQRNDNINNPPKWRVRSGEPVVVRLRNEGAVPHDFTILRAGVDVPAPFRVEENEELILYSTDEVGRGETGEFTVPELKPGEYMVICSVLGHFPMMQARLEVESNENGDGQ